MTWYNDRDREAFDYYIANGFELNKAGGVTVTPASVGDETHWIVLGVFNLQPENNRVALALLSEDGEYLGPAGRAIGWMWDGKTENERADPVELKAQPERGLIGLFRQPLSVYGILGGLKSDVVSGITKPVYVVFGRGIVDGAAPPEEDPPDEEPPDDPADDCAEFIAAMVAKINAQVAELDKLDAVKVELISIRDDLLDKNT